MLHQLTRVLRSRSPVCQCPAPGVARLFGTTPRLPSTREITDEDVANYNRDGYLFIRNMFDAEEVALLKEAVETDPANQENSMSMADGTGGRSILTLWNDAGDDTYGMFARGRRWTNAVAKLIKSEPYHLHTKLMLKEPHTGGRWEWHQDFGYWHQLGVLKPDVMLSSILAIDTADQSNGCLQVLRSSHTLGRLGHGVSGEQAGADPAFVEQALAKFELVHCKMGAGDVLLTHSNLLHASASNSSDRWRRFMIVAYNGEDNEPWDKPRNMILPRFEKIDVVDDGAIKAMGVSFHSKERGLIKDGSPQRGFLDVQTNTEQFSKGQA